MVATAMIGGSVLSAGTSLAGASMQADATNKATDVQKQMYDQTRSDLMPYQATGQYANNLLVNSLSSYMKPITMDQATLEQTPGYQFNLSQGLKSVQNSAAARGLGSSGAAMKGAASYATGLADSTYQNQFNNAWTNRTNAYNMLSGAASLGENAAAQTGAYGTQAATNIGNNTIQGGNAMAAGLNGASNALTNGINNYATYKYMTTGMYG